MGLGCIGFLPYWVRKKYQKAVQYCQKLNTKAHLIEVFNEKQQKFVMKSKVVKKVKKYLGKYYNSFRKYPVNFWLGAELWRSNWYWTRWGKKVEYVPRTVHFFVSSTPKIPLDKELTQAYAYMSLTKKSVQWKVDRPKNHDGNRKGGSTLKLMPLCQISRETRRRSKNLGE